MELFINGKREDINLDLNDFGEAFQKIQNWLLERNQMIKDLYLNGALVNLRDIDTLQAYPLSERDKIEVNTMDKKAMVLASLREIQAYFPKLIHQTQNISTLFQIGSRDRALEMLSSYLDNIETFTRSLQGIELLLGLKLEGIKIDGFSMYVMITRLEEILRKVMKVLENNEAMALGELLRLEMISELESWQKLFPQLIKYVDSKA